MSPRLKGSSVILLGEAYYTIAAISSYRFGAIAVPSAGGLSIVLRGNVGESVTLRFVPVSVTGGVLVTCEI